MRTLATALLVLVPTLASADDGAGTICTRAADAGRDAPLVCRADGVEFTVVPAGQRLVVTDVIAGGWSGRLEAAANGATIWSFPLNGARAGEGGASFSFTTGLGVPTGASLLTPGNGGAVLVSGRLVPIGG